MGIDNEILDEVEGKWISKVNRTNEATPSSNDRKVILVVDDVLEFLNMVNSILSKYYSVSLAKSAEQAGKILSKKHVDLVLLDHGMTEMNGLAFLKVMRNTPMFAAIPVVFLTANATLELIEEAKVHGVSGFLVKPIDPVKLLEKVSGILAATEPT
jgi:putative two-component system response regulator